MQIAIVKVNSNTYVEKAIKKLGHTFKLFQINDPNLVQTIEQSSIQKWIFTGTGIATSVLNPLAPQVPLEILQIKDKEFFLICYSMVSLLHQLGYPLLERKPRKERFQMGPLTLYRNHRFYFECEKLKSISKNVECYKGEGMTVFYKNTVMTQWHPERTPDGIQCLQAWIEN